MVDDASLLCSRLQHLADGTQTDAYAQQVTHELDHAAIRAAADQRERDDHLVQPCFAVLSQISGRWGVVYDLQRRTSGKRRLAIEFKGSHFERDVILWGVRWYVAYPISYRQLEEMMEVCRSLQKGNPFSWCAVIQSC